MNDPDKDLRALYDSPDPVDEGKGLWRDSKNTYSYAAAKKDPTNAWKKRQRNRKRRRQANASKRKQRTKR